MAFKKGQSPWNKGSALGIYKSRFYCIWTNMKSRCTNKNVPCYERYGGRGIKICDKWNTFKGFYEDMYGAYRSDLTLERIDNDKGYSKENCRWASRREQSLNTRNVYKAKRHIFNGNQYTVRELALLSGIKRTTLDMRLNKYGWSIEKALQIGGTFE